MKKLPQRIFSSALLLVAVLGFAQSARSQTGTGTIVVEARRGPHPAWEGKAAGETKPFESNDADLKMALLSQPVPDVWLEFVESQREGQASRQSASDEPIIKVMLPPEANTIVKLLWQDALKFDYNQAFAKAKSAQEGYDRYIGWINKCFAAKRKFQQVEIATPDGKRAISDVEADDIIFFVHKASIDLIDEAKDNKNRSRRIGNLTRR